MRILMEEVLLCASKRYRLFGSIHDEAFVRSAGLPFIHDWSERRIARGVWHQNLRTHERMKAYLRPTEQDKILIGSGPEVLREIRYAPAGIRLPTLIYLFDEKVAFVSGAHGKQYAAILESKDVHDGLDTLFTFLWDLSMTAEDAERLMKGSSHSVVRKRRQTP